MADFCEHARSESAQKRITETNGVTAGQDRCTT
jgi:hypothetical protein